ncbi:hypothetical protein EVAR_47497_1 [Eumeta japonica]|uniref:Retrovirus-related Pol polyprotein from transposon TNT 1-94 n=1 Tax=Eumeta variegata TaxID=151549 RepID=A0A4C1XUV5_EUMVA|nr:hypothetical protein EVAR_47497_1 [Eumeta japonica]
MEGNNSVIKLEEAGNWNIWKFQTMVLLQSQSNLSIIEGKEVKPKNADERAKWECRDAKAQMLIVIRMTENVMLHLNSCETLSKIWRKLLSVYEQKSETSIDIM